MARRSSAGNRVTADRNCPEEMHRARFAEKPRSKWLTPRAVTSDARSGAHIRDRGRWIVLTKRNGARNFAGHRIDRDEALIHSALF
jgi:hypothetical protein